MSAEAIDQIFITLKHAILGWLAPYLPDWLMPIVSAVLSITPILMVFPLVFALTTVVERKVLGRIQNRPGPNRVGIPLTNIRLAGFGQFIADGIKALIKEDVVPRNADKVVHFLAPIALVIPVLLAYSVLPIGKNMTALDLDSGVLFFFAVGSATELSVFMAGWSSRNKYALLGAMRAIAQMVSYELPLVLSTVGVIMMTGTLSTAKIVDAQAGGFWHWHAATPWGFAAFFLFLIAATAEANRTPFDLPEAESEIIAGYFTEYSGFKFALFFLGEYLGLFAMSGLGITLFLGGWHAPLPALEVVPSWIWFFLKLGVFILFFIWLRGTFPRLRMDQLMNLAWKFMVPLTLITIVAAGVWRFMDPGATRCLTVTAMIVVPYLLLSNALYTARGVGKRTYRYAE
ncbi:MAG: NADH-quinone oxidoreductase subunit NuoH [Verrucomicrobia bacterium]|nr:NADH-quinone oxidoreductase subunit NuoH [Verrucomicrobiota bacterium]